MGPKVQIRHAAEGTCRGCGARFVLGYAQNPRGNGEEPCLLHPTPQCADFQKRDVLEFLQWNRMGDA